VFGPRNWDKGVGGKRYYATVAEKKRGGDGKNTTGRQVEEYNETDQWGTGRGSQKLGPWGVHKQKWWRVLEKRRV